MKKELEKGGLDRLRRRETATDPSWPPPADHPKGELLSTGFFIVH
jgi:hypothetical protein